MLGTAESEERAPTTLSGAAADRRAWRLARYEEVQTLRAQAARGMGQGEKGGPGHGPEEG